MTHDPWIKALRRIHGRIREDVIDGCAANDSERLSRVAGLAPCDTIYALDRIGEHRLLELFTEASRDLEPVILVAEGLANDGVVLPEGTPADQAKHRIIIDPIDGTRSLMYQKRSAWILTGVAPNLGPETSLLDIELAVQTEIPLAKQHLADQVWAVRGEGAQAVRWNKLDGSEELVTLRPSSATDIAHGFAMISRFFPGAREVLAEIDEEIMRGAPGALAEGQGTCFEDQYLSSGGQLYELMTGHDRFVADLRPFINHVQRERGQPECICCHPYDICTELIARELGVEVTDVYGEPLSAPLDTESSVAWAGYANAELRSAMEPLLLSALETRGLL